MSEPRAVLVVDDSDSIRLLLRLLLEQEGWSVSEAADGAAALAVLDSCRVDAIVSDLSMPGMDGMSLLHALRENPRHRGVPVLVLSTDAREQARAAARAEGARAFLKKPCLPGDLVAALERLCQRGTPSAPARCGAPASAACRPTPH